MKRRFFHSENRRHSDRQAANLCPILAILASHLLRIERQKSENVPEVGLTFITSEMWLSVVSVAFAQRWSKCQNIFASYSGSASPDFGLLEETAVQRHIKHAKKAGSPRIGIGFPNRAGSSYWCKFSSAVRDRALSRITGNVLVFGLKVRFRLRSSAAACGRLEGPEFQSQKNKDRLYGRFENTDRCKFMFCMKPSKEARPIFEIKKRLDKPFALI